MGTKEWAGSTSEEQEAQVLEQIEELELQKSEAVRAEDYAAAGDLKRALDALRERAARRGAGAGVVDGNDAAALVAGGHPPTIVRAEREREREREGEVGWRGSIVSANSNRSRSMKELNEKEERGETVGGAGGAQGGGSEEVLGFLFVGCFAFGGYLIAAMAFAPFNRQSAKLLRSLRRKVWVFQGKEVTGVHVVEGIVTLWSLMCVEAATYVHFHELVPVLMCHDAEGGGVAGGLIAGSTWSGVSGVGGGARVCRGGWEYVLVHLIPSAYLHVCFYYNWYMVIFGSSPADAYDVEVTPWAALQAYQAADDQEHWSSGVSLVDKTCEEEDGLCGEEEDDGEAGLRATCSSTGTPVRLRLQEEGGRERGLRVGVGVGRSDVAGHGEMRESRPAITAIDLHATRHELHARVASGASGGTGRTRQRVGCQRVGAGPLGTDGDVLRGHFCKVSTCHTCLGLGAYTCLGHSCLGPYTCLGHSCLGAYTCLGLGLGALHSSRCFRLNL